MRAALCRFRWCLFRTRVNVFFGDCTLKKPRKAARPTPRGEANARIEEAIETGLMSKLLGHALAGKISSMRKNKQEETFRGHDGHGPEKDSPEPETRGQREDTTGRNMDSAILAAIADLSQQVNSLETCFVRQINELEVRVAELSMT